MNSSLEWHGRILSTERVIFGAKKICEIIVLLSVTIMLSHCATALKEASVSPSPLKPESIENEIKRFEEIASKHGNASERANARIELARLYSSYKNPKPNYQQALRELEAYLSIRREKGDTDEMQNWSALLNEIVRTNEELRKAKQKINQLTKENKELKDAVEKLKELDIKMEEKRKHLE